VILVLDNRDSFTFNLVQALQVLGQTVEVRAARTSSLAALRRTRPARVLIGPGPGTPAAAGLSLAAVEAFQDRPVLGVCLGHQALALACGARIERSVRPLHGSTTLVEHDGRGLFAGLPGPLRAMRYNSLTVLEATVPACLEVSAHDEGGEVMGLRHRERPLEGVQFHPESVLSEHGLELLANFVRA
jgi:para-aminobenzoate synthetase component 2